MDAKILEQVAAAASGAADSKGAGKAPGEDSKPALQQEAPMPLASVAALASKVLLEQSQEAAAAGQRMVLGADRAHTTVLTDAKHRKSAIATEQQMHRIASKDEAERAAAEKQAATAKKAMLAAEEARAGHAHKAEDALSAAVGADQQSADDKQKAKELEADAVEEARQAEVSKAAETRAAEEVRQSLRRIGELKKGLVVNKDWVAGYVF